VVVSPSPLVLEVASRVPPLGLLTLAAVVSGTLSFSESRVRLLVVLVQSDWAARVP
jgi:hypothetical protein